ncbi:MAG: hypothetical protein MUO85_01665 [candidate division Zixibacteria bacterium]|nr:hypothetical protein [candidate division Zixibacteria bacterium]
MKRILILLLLFSLVFINSALAFDGERKGFVMGGGLGFAPASRWSTGGFNENSVGFGDDALIGYAWNEKNMIVLEGNGTFYNSDILDVNILQFFLGPSWYHYFGPQEGRTFFSAVGIGGYYFGLPPFYSYISFCINCGEMPPAPPDHARGFGYLIGGSYEFARHFQIGAYLAGGKTSERGTSYDNMHYHDSVE